MGRTRKKIHINHNSEFDLDLAPLLAVMVKLVPVLLVSSAFVQLMTIETQLPQIVQEALKEQDKNPLQPQVVAEMDRKSGFVLHYLEKGSEIKTTTVANNPDGSFNLNSVKSQLLEFKKSHPEIFKLELKPSENVSYQEIVRIIDVARTVKDQGKPFALVNSKTGQKEATDLMYPEVVFANVFEK